MRKICLVFGGDSLESEISILTALKVKEELEKFSYPFELVYMDHDGNFFTGKGLFHKDNYYHKTNFKVGYFYRKNNKNYFKFGFNNFEFDIVLLLCHGMHAEDGTLGAYFDAIKIPCIYPGLEVSALVQNKSHLKKIVNCINVPVVKSLTFNEEEYQEKIDLVEEKLRYPLIVKPNYLGSSIGVKKVFNKEELKQAMFEVFRYDNYCLVEECIENLKEVNIACFKLRDELVLSMIERVNDEEKILSFNDKYDYYSFNERHIIPADISPKVSKLISYYTKKVYNYLNIKSVVRFDYLYDQKNNKVYLNEINAIPGSLAYYLFEKMDIKMIDLIDSLIEQYYIDYNHNKKKISSYKEEFLSSLKEK